MKFDVSLVHQNSPAFRNHGYLIMCQIGESIKQLGTPEGWENIKKAWHDHGDFHFTLKVKKAQFMVRSCFSS